MLTNFPSTWAGESSTHGSSSSSLWMPLATPLMLGSWSPNRLMSTVCPIKVFRSAMCPLFSFLMSFHILSESTCVEISSSLVVLLSWFSWPELLELSDPLRWAAFCCCLAMLFSFLPPLPRPIVDG